MAGFPQLLDEISNHKSFPIEISSIAQWFKHNGFQDEINFIPVDIDPDKATAYIKRRSGIAAPYQEKPWICDIIYSKNMNECWRRFLCCKELMHLFDTPDVHVNSAETTRMLISELISLKVAREPISDFARADINGYQKALLTLAPLHVIDELRPHYDNGTKTSYQIALFLKIPEFYIETIFSEDYAQSYVNHKNELSVITNSSVIK